MDEVGQVGAAIEDRLAAEPRLTAAWLFGSVARGTASAGSDVDVAVLGFPAGATLPSSIHHLAAELADLVGREVDLVRLEDAGPDLAVRVLRDGVLLVDRDPPARVRFEVDARNRYFDMLPIWREYRRPRAS